MARTEYGLRLDVKAFRTEGSIASAKLLLESLRYAGLVENDEGADEFVIAQPRDVNGSVWSTQNARRLASFGVRAEIIARPAGNSRFAWRDAAGGSTQVRRGSYAEHADQFPEVAR